MTWPRPFHSSSADDSADDSTSFTDTDWLPAPPSFPSFTDGTGSTATGGGTGGGGSTASVPATQTVTYAGSGLVFVNDYGSGVTAAFQNEIVAAENFYQSHYTNACTVTCSFNVASLNPAYSGENSFSPICGVVRAAAQRAGEPRHIGGPAGCGCRAREPARSERRQRIRDLRRRGQDIGACGRRAPAALTTPWCSTAITGRPRPCRITRTTPSTSSSMRFPKA